MTPADGAPASARKHAAGGRPPRKGPDERPGRVQLCRDSGMGLEDIAHATGHSKGLLREYLDLIEEFHLPPIANPNAPDSVQTGPTLTPNGT